MRTLNRSSIQIFKKQDYLSASLIALLMLKDKGIIIMIILRT